nr:hypothetical protein [Tanacetum cinerariifolium]
MRESTANDQANYYSRTHEEEVEHIEYFLKIVDPIDLPNDNELKDEALRNKAIMEGTIDDDDESSNNGWRRWVSYEIADRDQEEREYENAHEDKERCELFDDHELLVNNIRRFKMIKYSFEDDEEYVAVKEDEYDDLTSTSKDACRAYQEIFRMMDEGCSNYQKNIEGYTLKQLKLKEFDKIQEMFDRAFKRVNTFEDYRTKLVEGKEKRAGEELIQEITKKQKGRR